MSNFSQSNRNHKQPTPLAQPLSSTSSNVENGTQPHSPRLPARQVPSEHDANETSFYSPSTSEPGNLGDRDLGADDWSNDSGHFINVSDLIVPSNMRWRGEIRAANRAKEAKFLTSVPTTTVVTPPPTPLLDKFVSLLHTITVDVKAKASLSRPALSYRNSYDVPAPEHPGASITSICLTVPPGCPPKARKILMDPKERGNLWERCYDGYNN